MSSKDGSLQSKRTAERRCGTASPDAIPSVATLTRTRVTATPAQNLIFGDEIVPRTQSL